MARISASNLWNLWYSSLKEVNSLSQPLVLSLG
jgi:hypothetical protein